MILKVIYQLIHIGVNMPIENERKLLLGLSRAQELLTVLKQHIGQHSIELFDITQGYLSSNARVRQSTPHVTGLDKFYFTYKKRIGEQTIELEQSISVHDYQKLFLISKPVVVKTRARIDMSGYHWDVDFLRKHKSGEIYIAMAEVEMPEFQNELPPIHPLLEPYALRWIDATDKRFNNRNLANVKRAQRAQQEVLNGTRVTKK